MASTNTDGDDPGAPIIAVGTRRTVEALQLASAEPAIVAWSTHVQRAMRRIDVPSGVAMWLVPAGSAASRVWRYDAPTRALARVLRREACRVVLCPATVEAPRVGVAAGLVRAAVVTVGDGRFAFARRIRPPALARAGVDDGHVAVLQAFRAELGHT